jgi:2-dehydro-3-deoxy-D-gluconate 5-dehydrogenase
MVKGADMSLFDLTGKIAMITGASRGLGRAMAIGMAQAGATVVAIGRDKAALEETADAIDLQGGNSKILRLDICDDQAIQEMMDTVMASFGRIDILVNNAGVSAMNRTSEISKAEWNRIIDTNLNAVFVISKAVGEQMIARRQGNIVNIASVLGKMASNRALHYCASKAAIMHMTRALALEWAAYNIRVNCIAPGFFKTEMTKVQQEDDRHRTFLINKIPLRRLGEPEEIIGSVLFLSSDASKYVTGSTVFVDGGYSIW